MQQNNLLAPTRAGAPRGPRHHDGTIIPDTVDAMWGTDLTSTITGEGQAAVFVAIDHCSAECVGIHAHVRATRFQALEPIRQGVRQHFGGFAKAIAHGLGVRHDHGSPYMSDHFQKELAFLGIDSSPAFVRSPEGNGCAERFIRTLKENLLWVRTFKTVEELRQALLAFREIYNSTWLIEGTDSSARLNIGSGSFNRSLRQRRLQSGVPKTAGGTAATAANLFLVHEQALENAAAKIERMLTENAGLTPTECFVVCLRAAAKFLVQYNKNEWRDIIPDSPDGFAIS